MWSRKHRVQAWVVAKLRRQVHPRLRRRKLAVARRRAQQWDARSLLVVGIDPTYRDGLVNMIERELAADIDDCVATGIKQPAGGLAGWRYVAADARALPFPDDAFDLVYANAVIEHVGDEADQRRFASEIDRVGKNWMMTTPNLCFPVEAHTWAFLRHWTVGWRTQHSGWITRLLTPTTFADLLPRGKVVGTVFSPTLTAVSS